MEVKCPPAKSLPDNTLQAGWRAGKKSAFISSLISRTYEFCDRLEKLEDDEFKKGFELERAKVALAQKIAELRQQKKLRQIGGAKILL